MLPLPVVVFLKAFIFLDKLKRRGPLHNNQHV